jgi:hypothetical protein
MDAAATGYDYNWVGLQLGVRCYGVRAARGCGYNWVRVVNKGCYNWVWLKLGAITTGCMRIKNLSCGQQRVRLQLGATVDII